CPSCVLGPTDTVPYSRRVVCVFTVVCDNLSPNRRNLNAEARLHCLTLPSRSQSFRICGTEEICQEATGNRSGSRQSVYAKALGRLGHSRPCQCCTVLCPGSACVF